MLHRFHDKGMFYWESAHEMWNRHIEVPKIAPELLFPINGINCNDKMAILSFFVLMKLIYTRNHVIINNFYILQAFKH
jgi:hypothetical protein